MRDDVDRFEPFPALDRTCHLARCRFSIGQLDSFHIGPDPSQQCGKIVHIAVDEGDFATGHCHVIPPKGLSVTEAKALLLRAYIARR